MKKNLFTLGAVVLAVCGAHAFAHFQANGISGKVKPADAVDMVWAIQGTDSSKTAPVNGTFTLTVKPGQYQVIVDAKQGYKDVVMDRITVEPGKTTDLGEINIEKGLQ